MTLYADKAVRDSIAANIQLMDFTILTKLENDLEPHEIISLVFLLYDEPYVALEKIRMFETISTTTDRPNMDLLLHWAMNVQSAKPMWRYELLEALCICQLYSNIQKLQFDVTEVKKHFVPGNVHLNIYVHPMKKLLYKICEELTSDKIFKLKRSLDSFEIDCDELNTAETMFLRLICKKFLLVGSWQDSRNLKKLHNRFTDVTKFAEILKGMGYVDFYKDLVDTQDRLNGKHKSNDEIEAPSTSYRHPEEEVAMPKLDLSELEKQIEQLMEEAPSASKLKIDASSLPKDAYKIIDPADVGILYIINQVKFFPSQQSLRLQIDALEDRFGSEYDREMLKETFTKFGFTVIVDENLKHDLIKSRIQSVVTENVKDTHSAFVLCILSHGMKGQVFGSDSVPVKVDEIQDILYADNAPNLIGKPKIMLIQACQGIDEAKKGRIVSDGPRRRGRSVPVKADMITYWATVPGHASYRDIEKGSIFIQVLCRNLVKYAHKEHLQDIFTRVSGYIQSSPNIIDLVTQVPEQTNNTLRAKIYLISQ